MFPNSTLYDVRLLFLISDSRISGGEWRFRRRRKRPAADTRMQKRADKRVTMVAMFALTARMKKMGEDDEKNVVVDLKREKAKKRVRVALFS